MTILNGLKLSAVWCIWIWKKKKTFTKQPLSHPSGPWKKIEPWLKRVKQLLVLVKIKGELGSTWSEDAASCGRTRLRTVVSDLAHWYQRTKGGTGGGGGVPFVTVLLWPRASREATGVTRRGLSSHPCKHFCKHASSETRIQTNSDYGWSHEAGQSCVCGVNGIRKVNMEG